MGIEKVFKYYLLGESLKEIEVNRILNKISKKSILTRSQNQKLMPMKNQKHQVLPILILMIFNQKRN